MIPGHDEAVGREATYDVVVVGAGPSGAITALELAGRGASVLLVDRQAFPRAKVCGCCVNPRALEMLHQAGLGQLAPRLGAVPLTAFVLGCGGGRAILRHSLGMAVSRAAFDAALAEAARGRGAWFLPETAAALLPAAGPGVRSVRLLRQGRSWTVRGRFVVSATGLADPVRGDGGGSVPAVRPAAGSRIGAGVIAPDVPAGYPRGEVWMACGAAGYVGLVVVEDGRLDIAAALCPVAVRSQAGIGPLVESILAEARFPEVPGVADLPWKGTPVLTRRARAVAEDRVFRVGDAAGYVEPFTGEGIAWALAGGRALARILHDALAGRDGSPERAWMGAYRREVSRTQVVCRAARRALRHPWMTRWLVRILDAQPGLARPLLRSLHRTSCVPSAPAPRPPGIDR